MMHVEKNRGIGFGNYKFENEELGDHKYCGWGITESVLVVLHFDMLDRKLKISESKLWWIDILRICTSYFIVGYVGCRTENFGTENMVDGDRMVYLTI